MKTTLALLLFLGVWVMPSLGLAAPPVVHIDAPTGGYSSSRVAEVKGRIEGNPSSAILVVNGSERPLQMLAGGNAVSTFSASLLIPPGHNTLIVEARNAEGTGRSSVSYFANVPKLDLSVVLSWDTDGTDIDLHVTDPAGEECDYTHKLTSAGAKLDVDDTDGFGPEIFTLANALEGKYVISVRYFSDNGYPQTLATVDVILYEGTSAEKRYRFDAMLTRTGSSYTVGEFFVSPALQ